MRLLAPLPGRKRSDIGNRTSKEENNSAKMPRIIGRLWKGYGRRSVIGIVIEGNPNGVL